LACACSAAVLERALKRLEWEKVKERETQDAADEAERERQAYQAVDW
jgi:splicing factor 3A subunit 1